MNTNTKKLDGKVAVVTGASKGIGADIAKQFAAEGAAVVVNYASSKEGADRVVDEITKRGGKAIAIQGNVAKKAEVERLFAEAEKAFGKVDILVNNAGVYEFVPLEEVTEEQFHRMFDVNVLGMLLATQEALKHFNSDGGSIINIGSLASSLTPPTAVVYNATKGAVDAITRTLAKELGPTENSSERRQSWNGDHGRSRSRRFYRGRFPENVGVADAAGPHRPNGRHRACCSILRFVRFGVDYRRNAARCGRPSLAITTGDLSPSSSEYVRHHYNSPSGRDGKAINLSRTGEQESPREWYYKIPHTRHGRDMTVTDNVIA